MADTNLDLAVEYIERAKGFIKADVAIEEKMKGLLAKRIDDFIKDLYDDEDGLEATCPKCNKFYSLDPIYEETAENQRSEVVGWQCNECGYKS